MPIRPPKNVGSIGSRISRSPGSIRTGFQRNPSGTITEATFAPVTSFGGVSNVAPDTAAQLTASNQQRQQMLRLLGLSQLGESGGLLGQNVFQGLLGNPLGETVGDISSGLAEGGLFGSPGGGRGGLGQPGAPDSPGNQGLFGELIGARRAFGADVLQDLSQFGEAQRQRLGERFDTLGNNVQANLEARGLGSSNLAVEGQIGVEDARQQSMLDLANSLLGRQVETKAQLGESLFGDVGRELDRGVQRTGITSNLISSLLGSTLGVI